VCDPVDPVTGRPPCGNCMLQTGRHAHLKMGHSGIKEAGWGLYTRDALAKDDLCQEYLGELLSQEEAERRGRVYDKLNRSYLFNVDSENVVDACKKACKMRFANHKKGTANCYTKVMLVNGDHRIGIFAKNAIAPETEVRQAASLV
jgi:histone-lysine N-methyltransferase EZH2